MKKIIIFLSIFALAKAQNVQSDDYEYDQNYPVEEEKEEIETTPPELISKSSDVTLEKPLRLPCQVNRPVNNDISFIWTIEKPNSRHLEISSKISSGLVFDQGVTVVRFVAFMSWRTCFSICKDIMQRPLADR